MKNTLFVLAFVAAFSLLSAQGMPQDAGARLYLPESSANFTMIGGDPTSASFAGHDGNYTVIAWATDKTVYVNLIGGEATASNVASELGFLQSAGALSSICNVNEVAIMDWANRFICLQDGTWLAFAPNETLPLPPEYDEQALKNTGCGGTGGECIPTTGAGNIPPSAPGLFNGMGRSVASAPTETASDAPLSPTASAGLGTEQVLQLLGAFLAVLVASYLILQSRHEPLIDAATNRLLENPTRAGIMEELSSADKIPTDISARLGKSKASVVEHLAALSEAGLVERIATPGKKFVFYKLTQKGRQILLRRAG